MTESAQNENDKRVFTIECNPKNEEWEDFSYQSLVEQFNNGVAPEEIWSFHGGKKARPGDRVFLLKVGGDNGIFASGYIITKQFPQNKALIKFDAMLPIDSDIFLKQKDAGINITPLCSGFPYKGSFSELEKKWQETIAKAGIRMLQIPEEDKNPEPSKAILKALYNEFFALIEKQKKLPPDKRKIKVNYTKWLVEYKNFVEELSKSEDLSEQYEKLLYNKDNGIPDVGQGQLSREDYNQIIKEQDLKTIITAFKQEQSLTQFQNLCKFFKDCLKNGKISRSYNNVPNRIAAAFTTDVSVVCYEDDFNKLTNWLKERGLDFKINNENDKWFEDNIEVVKTVRDVIGNQNNDTDFKYKVNIFLWYLVENYINNAEESTKWTEFYRKFAEKILELWKDKTLLEKLNKCYERHKLPKPNYLKEERNLEQINPFDIYVEFSSGRKKPKYECDIINGLADSFGFSEEIPLITPNDLSGRTSLTPRNPITGKKDLESDQNTCNLLWEYLEIITASELNRNNFCKLYNNLSDIDNMGRKMTILAFYWRPDKFLPLDTTIEDYFYKQSIFKELTGTKYQAPNTGKEYLELCDTIVKVLENDENRQKVVEFYKNQLNLNIEITTIVDLSFAAYKLREKCEKNKKNNNYAKMLSKLKANGQLILTGTPGTGKTFTARQLAIRLIEGYSDSDDPLDDAEKDGRFKFVQFHPGYDYTDFVEGIKPEIDENTKKVVFRRRLGVFGQFCYNIMSENEKFKETNADKENPDKYVIVIDEINRADLSKVFGELFSGIEKEYRGRPIATQYSYLPLEVGGKTEELTIPSNLYIIGTMNDIDRSVDSMDFALRRRFAWHEISAEDSKAILDSMEESECYDREILKKAMDSLNNMIAYKEKGKQNLTPLQKALGRHYQLGGSYFKKIENYNDIKNKNSYQQLWDNHLTIILSEYLRQFSAAERANYLVEFKKVYNEAVGLEESKTSNVGDGQSSQEDDYRTTALTLLNANKQIILTGAPGTGKTYLAQQLAAAKILNKSLDSKEVTAFLKALNNNGKDVKHEDLRRYKFVQFHHGYDYTDFVEGLKPELSDSHEVVFKRRLGVFGLFCKEASDAYDNNKEIPPNYVIVVDEINRADLSRVLGELFVGLEYRNQEIDTPYSSIKLDENDDEAYKLKIPPNLYIIGTMNDIDRSVDSMDFALRRRFGWQEILASDSQDGILNEKITKTNLRQQAKDRMNAVNELIGKAMNLGQEYQLGAAYFAKIQDYKDCKDCKDPFEELWDNHISVILEEYLRTESTENQREQLEELKNAYDNKTQGKSNKTQDKSDGSQNDDEQTELGDE